MTPEQIFNLISPLIKIEQVPFGSGAAPIVDGLGEAAHAIHAALLAEQAPAANEAVCECGHSILSHYKTGCHHEMGEGGLGIYDCRVPNRELTKQAERDALSLRQQLAAANQERETLRQQVEQIREWQPIETAPRDGSKFVATDGEYTFTTSLGQYYEKFPGEKGGPTFKDAWNAEDKFHLWPWRPTHWLALPTKGGAQ